MTGRVASGTITTEYTKYFEFPLNADNWIVDKTSLVLTRNGRDLNGNPIRLRSIIDAINFEGGGGQILQGSKSHPPFLMET